MLFYHIEHHLHRVVKSYSLRIFRLSGCLSSSEKSCPGFFMQVKEVYQSTHVRFQGLSPDSALYVRLRADISGRLSILSEMVNVTTPPIGEQRKKELVKGCQNCESGIPCQKE